MLEPIEELKKEFDILADDFIDFSRRMYKKNPEIRLPEMEEKLNKEDLELYISLDKRYNQLLLQSDKITDKNKTLKIKDFAKIFFDYKQKVMIAQLKIKGYKLKNVGKATIKIKEY